MLSKHLSYAAEFVYLLEPCLIIQADDLNPLVFVNYSEDNNSKYAAYKISLVPPTTKQAPKGQMKSACLRKVLS